MFTGNGLYFSGLINMQVLSQKVNGNSTVHSIYGVCYRL